MPIPVLHANRLTLRPLHAGDWDAYAAMNADPVVREGLGGALLSPEQCWTQIESCLGQWALRDYGIFAVEVNATFAGRAGLLHPADWPEPELCWTLARPFWGQGLATEAAAAVRQWAFDQFGWDRLVSFIMPQNARSRRVAEKLGAIRHGQITLRGYAPDVWVHRR